MRVDLLALAVLIPCLGSGCYLSHEERMAPDAMADAGVDAPIDAFVDAPIDAAADAPADAPADVVDTGVCDAGPIEPGLELMVDMVFVVDSSGSMSEEQRALAREFPRMVRMLATGDLDEDGRPEFEPVTDLRVAVITTELTTGDIDVPGCTPSRLDGDNGVLRRHGYFWREECDRDYPQFLEFHAGGTGAEQFVQDFSCVAQVGTTGCGYEQPLEAALRALTPSTSDITFLDGAGHRDGENAGFVRDDAILAVVVITDEDDCSVADPGLFDLESARYPYDPMAPSPRCFAYPEALTSTDRYVEGFQRFKDGDPDSFFFAAITGVPLDMVTDPASIDYDALRADPRMARRLDSENPERLAAACDVVGIGYAEPATRILAVAEGLGDSATVRSICDATFTEALAGITAQLGRVIRRRRCH
ncbi:MAG: hypothetical protein DRJ42_19920 [Deltaproteobacteria bacterium]|nr:MAG: hypothetical protein DRJ42_19920 [Deltaproteobacteria bacterium]